MGQHPFPTEYGDHFETPRSAYAHLAPALGLLAALLGKTQATIRIYDPFFCAGEGGTREGVSRLSQPSI